MKHAGKARQAGLKILFWSLVLAGVLVGLEMLAGWVKSPTSFGVMTVVVLWVFFALFCINFFRDPSPQVPAGSDAIVSPAHGTVDVIDELEEPEFYGGKCRRISIFLSVADVHIQNAPISGEVVFQRHKAGKFMNALKTESAAHNENVLIGFRSSEKPGEKVGVRLIAGLIARRIIPWTAMGDQVDKGQRISLIQFGSRVDIYLPLTIKVNVQLGDKVKGGETVVARRV